MTNKEMARGAYARALRILREAERHYQEEAWNLVVRRCQEAVEPALKGALREVGLEVPRVHDVGAFLKKHRERFVGRLSQELNRIVSISRHLRAERETSFYGDEELDLPPEELYTREDAANALKDARFVVEICGEFLEGGGK